MATPRNFAGANEVLKPAAGDEGNVGHLPCYMGPEGIITCWELTPAERELVARTGLIWRHQPRRDIFVPEFISAFPMMELRNADGILIEYDPDADLNAKKDVS